MTLDHADSDVIICEIKALQKPSQHVYLVGGAIRDLLLQRSIHDLDFVVNCSPIDLARRLADRLAGDFFVLDHERQTARVIHKLPGKQPVTIDFALLRGKTLEDDLTGRDFTLNAIAMDIENPSVYLDPLHGNVAIRQKVITACSKDTFTDDPLRILRMVRIALETGFSVENETKILAKSSLDRLESVSNERIRDELFKMMETEKPDLAVRLLEQLGVLRVLMPFLYADSQISDSVKARIENAASALSAAKKLNNVLVGNLPDTLTGNLVLGQASLSLGQYRYRLEEIFSQQLNSQRSHYALFYLAVFLAGLENWSEDRADSLEKKVRIHSGISQFINNLGLSQNEVRYLELTIASQNLFTDLLAIDGDLTRREKYRYFASTGERGIDMILMSLANTLSERSFSLDEAFWRHALDVSRQLMHSWWEEQTLVVDPERLVDGDELQARLGIPQSPLIGVLLGDLREEQAAGTVNTRDEAWAFLEARRQELTVKEGDTNE